VGWGGGGFSLWNVYYQSTSLSHKKISSFLLPVNNNLGFRTPGVYRIPCECSKVCIGKTGHFSGHQIKGASTIHPTRTYTQVSCSQTLHELGTPHSISHISILATKTHYMDHIVWEAIETEIHANNMNRDVGFCLSKSWNPLIAALKESL
jgi:hypothetical protein